MMLSSSNTTRYSGNKDHSGDSCRNTIQALVFFFFFFTYYALSHDVNYNTEGITSSLP